jgi:hypothetical protein
MSRWILAAFLMSTSLTLLNASEPLETLPSEVIQEEQRTVGWFEQAGEDIANFFGKVEEEIVGWFK